jgi:aromatic ring-opening dioxygenase catalytic subunit (LigB family)
MSSSTEFPVVFVTHGAGPMMFLESPPRPVFGEIDKHSPAAHWFRQLSKQLSLPSKPKAILIITAHWETTDILQINSQEQHPELFYDYYGFPTEAYSLTYNPPGDLQLSNRVKFLLEQAGIQAQLNDTRNFDHGVYIPLKLIYPDADIPIVSMSILDNLSPTQHLAIGKALAPLRKEQILIIGSGSTIHGGRVEKTQTDAFINKLIQVLTSSNQEERENVLINWDEKLPFARLNHPREEHFIPLHVIVGAAGSDRGELLNPNVTKTQAAFKFGA